MEIGIVNILLTQVPVIGALIAFLMYYIKSVEKRDSKRESWFIEAMDNKDEIYRSSLEKAWTVHRDICNKICDRIETMELVVSSCNHRTHARPPFNRRKTDMKDNFPEDNPSTILAQFPEKKGTDHP
jgi:hypothetical protein